MNKKRIISAGLLITTMGMTACNTPLQTVIPEPTINVNMSTNSSNLTKGKGNISVSVMNPSTSETSQLTNASMNLFSQTLKDTDDNENVLISPLSIQMALCMTENGANGDTLAELEKYVNGGVSSENINPIMASYKQRLSSDKDVKWNVANSIWFKDDGQVQMKDDFLDVTAAYYEADVWKAQFDDETLKDINNWVSKNTDGQINDMLDKIPDDARMYLVNAIAFEGKWADAYEDYQIVDNYEFTNADGSVSKVTALKSNEEKYFYLGEGTAFIKEYEGGNYSFVGILPDEGITTDEYIENLVNSGESFSDKFMNCESGEVHVTFPEFEMDYKTELSDTYKEIGMELPFDDNAADFYGLVETGLDGYRIWINRIIHQTHIEVNREGTKAAGATIVEMTDKCTAVYAEPEYIDITLDRPFVYAIVDNETGTPVFLGCQNSMK